MVRQVLGRGLGALIQEVDSVDQSAVRNLPISAIKPNPFQPRQHFDEEKLAELAASIKEHGVVQPLILRQREEGYELVAGERRWRAAQLAGLKEVPVVVKGLNDLQMMQIALVENLQREDLNPLEEARAYARLLNEFSMTQEEIAFTVGKSRPVVANTLRLLHLPEEIQESVSRGTISMGHARTILGLESPEQQITAWEKILKDQLSVRETERLVESLKEKVSTAP
ncbi:MAG: ParB/RepB/Spo0J family partition protein, partial [Syntrophothermus sp.]